MKTYIKLAWRNIWRNKRRTIITAASVFFAILFALVMRAFQLGSYDSMIYGVVQSFTGSIQIHAKGYWDEKTIDYLFEGDERLIKKINAVDNVKLAVPRFESFALASAGNQTKGAMVVGIDPEKEGIMTGLKDKVIHFRVTDKLLDDLKEKGLPESLVTGLKNYRKKSWTGEEDLRKNLTKAWSEKETEQYAGMLTDLCRVNGTYLSPDDDGVLIGDRMARFLKVGVGDTIVLLGQGYHGVSAAGKYPVRGFIRMPNPEIDNQMVYMPLESCRYLYSAEGLLTSVSIALEKPKELIKTVDAVRQAVAGDEYEIMSWKEMLTELVQQIESDNYSGIIMLWILYVIIGFGVFGTVLMMTAERRKEFAVAISVGMQKRTLVFIVFIEMIMLALLGIVSGILASIPIIRYFVANPIELTGEMADMMEMFGVEPIMPMAWQLDYFVNQSVTVAVIILVAVFYPLTKIFGLNIMKALRN